MRTANCHDMLFRHLVITFSSPEPFFFATFFLNGDENSRAVDLSLRMLYSSPKVFALWSLFGPLAAAAVTIINKQLREGF